MPDTCPRTGCTRPARTLGLCARHYEADRVQTRGRAEQATWPTIRPLPDLVSVLLSGPSLVGHASCRAAPTLFEPRALGESNEAADQRHERAIETCTTCEAYTSCASASEQMHNEGMEGFVLGGRVLRRRQPARPRADERSRDNERAGDDHEHSSRSA